MFMDFMGHLHLRIYILTNMLYCLYKSIWILSKVHCLLATHEIKSHEQAEFWLRTNIVPTI
jgi:hypothetical protein